MSVPTLETLAGQHTALLTTYRKDGTPVGTPVSVVVGGGRAYFRTYDRAWKTRRMARDPRVGIANSTVRGRPTGDSAHGTARLLSEDESKPVRRMLSRKYPVLHGVVVPIFHRLKKYRTLHYELVLDRS